MVVVGSVDIIAHCDKRAITISNCGDSSRVTKCAVIYGYPACYIYDYTAVIAASVSTVIAASTASVITANNTYFNGYRSSSPLPYIGGRGSCSVDIAVKPSGYCNCIMSGWSLYADVLRPRNGRARGYM